MKITIENLKKWDSHEFLIVWFESSFGESCSVKELVSKIGINGLENYVSWLLIQKPKLIPALICKLVGFYSELNKNKQ